MRFSGQTVIITGAFGGIGAACARRFAAEGASLVLADLHTPDADAFAAELSHAGAARALPMPCDVSREDDILAVCDAAGHRVDIVVNVAGAMIYKPLEDLALEDWSHVLGVNFLGAALFTREAFRRMTRGGAIVNVASIHARMTSPLVGPYAAAKAALVSLTRTASIEGAAKGIRANAVLPGAIGTPMLWASPNLKSGAEVLKDSDIGKPEDVAAAVAYLAGDEAKFVTGTTLTVDGGRLARL